MKFSKLSAIGLSAALLLLAGCDIDKPYERISGIDSSKARPENLELDVDGMSATSISVFWDGKKAGAQNLYIAKMKNPWTISGERVLLSEPEYTWEKKGGKINEAPELLVLGKQVHLTYSASSSTSDDCVLGMLSLTGSDPAFAVRTNRLA